MRTRRSSLHRLCRASAQALQIPGHVRRAERHADEIPLADRRGHRSSRRRSRSAHRKQAGRADDLHDRQIRRRRRCIFFGENRRVIAALQSDVLVETAHRKGVVRGYVRRPAQRLTRCVYNCSHCGYASRISPLR